MLLPEKLALALTLTWPALLMLLVMVLAPPAPLLTLMTPPAVFSREPLVTFKVAPQVLSTASRVMMTWD